MTLEGFLKYWELYTGGTLLFAWFAVNKYNRRAYKKHIGIPWKEMYTNDMISGWGVAFDPSDYVKAVARIDAMKDKRVFFWGALTTPLLFVCWAIIGSVYKVRDVGEALEMIETPSEDFYQKNREVFTRFDKVFKVLYFLIHFELD